MTTRKHAPLPPLIALARRVMGAMTGDAIFPTPNPPLVRLLADVEALAIVQETSLAGGAAVRDLRCRMLKDDPRALASYVAAVADHDQDAAIAVVQSASTRGRCPGGSPPQALRRDRARRGRRGRRHPMLPPSTPTCPRGDRR